jgi:hypothetical protein
MYLRRLVILLCTDISSDNSKFALANVPIVSLIPKISLYKQVLKICAISIIYSSGEQSMTLYYIDQIRMCNLKIDVVCLCNIFKQEIMQYFDLMLFINRKSRIKSSRSF